MNVLLLWTDEQRADTLSAYGNPWHISPYLDRLARESTVFANAYCCATVCTPSRGCVLTGLWPHQHGAVTNNRPMFPETRTIPEWLDGEYATSYIGKWHLGDEIFAQHGWDQWLNTDDSYLRYYSPDRDRRTRSPYHHWLLSQGYAPDKHDDSGVWFGRGFAAQLPECHSKPRWAADRAIEFIREQAARPWVCSVNLLEPHMPFTGPRNGMYDPTDMPVEPDWMAPLPEDGLLRNRIMRRIQHRERRFGLPDEAAVKKTRARYWGLCSQVDHHFGRILEALDASGQYDDTLIVFTSDHGDMMGGHGLMAKSVAYEPAARIPLLMKLPGQREGRRIESPVSHIDLVPTLLDAVNGAPPAELPGSSLLAAARAGEEPRRDVVLVWRSDDGHDSGNCIGENMDGLEDLGSSEELDRHLRGSHRVLITPDRWKLVASEFGERELYDLNTDPWELCNLAHHTAQAARRTELEARLESWQNAVGDTCPLG